MSYRVAVIPGDGTGPEVIREGLKVLEAASRRFGLNVELKEFDYGGDRYLSTGEILPDGAVEELKSFDAIYLGAIGHPKVKPGILEQGLLLKLRFELDQYINLRPVKLYEGVDCPLKDKRPEDIDFIVVRENTEGLYCGSGGFLRKGTPDEVAIQEMICTRKGVERCIRYAFDLAQSRPRKHLTLCAKTNVLTYAHDLWQRTFDEVATEYPDVETGYAHVDAVCMWMVKNPESFDVIVTCNMFGDIITDLGAMIQGGMGIAAGGNINPEGTSMFEPIGGSAPKYTGKNVINPLAAISALKMMLDFLAERAQKNNDTTASEAFAKAAGAVERGITETVAKLESLSAGKMGYSTTEVGDMVAHIVEEA